MTRMVPRALAVVLGAASIAAAACRGERASVEELYTTRMLGLGYLGRNQLPEAEAEFRKLTRLAPDDPVGHVDLGLTYLQAGRLADAERALRRARDLDPEGTDVGLALARVYALTDRPAEARAALERLGRAIPADPRVPYALAELEARDASRDAAAARRYEDRLRDVLAAAPANLVARLRLADALARRGAADSAVRHLEEVRRIPPEPPPAARARLDDAIARFRAGDLAAGRQALAALVDAMELTSPYQASMDEVRGIEGPIAGRLVLDYAPKDFAALRGTRDEAATGVARYVDATSDAGLDVPGPGAAAGAAPARAVGPTALAVGDVDGDGADDLFVSVASADAGRAAARLYGVRGGFARDVTAASGIALPAGAVHATLADLDGDGWLDLLAIDGAGRGRLFRNRGNGTFEDATARSGLADVGGARHALAADLDHDGDLDVLLAAGGARAAYRNGADGAFADATAAFGLAGAPRPARDAALGDLDGDGRLDVVVATAAGVVVLRNAGGGRLADATAASGLASGLAGGGAAGAAGAVAIGDHDNDGSLDLFVAAADGGEAALWRNDGRGAFARDRRSDAALRALGAAAVRAAAFVDHDNDGWLDLVVAGTGRAGAPGLFLLRNDRAGRLVDGSAALPAAARAAGGLALAPADVDGDGDVDLVLVDGAGATRLLRNDLGNANLAVQVELKALGAGSGKNNAFGIGARLDLRAGEIRQTRVATGRVTHFGLGPHLKADVLRVEWPNGVPQTVHFPGTDADVVEREMLKGSCAFVYTWDGTGFRFVTDAMWRSALGMPLGLMGGASAYAPAGASQEYVRIPGDALRPRDGRYVLQITEELWETAYADEIRLVAVDHPDSVDVFVDERFVPPGPVTRRVFPVARRIAPRTATDGRGTDLLPALRDADDVYVSALSPTRYQGVVEPHALVLDLGDEAGQPGTALFLRGWIYPTDASINVALGQRPDVKVFAPSLEVRDAAGRWRAVADVGFPSGKDKTIVVDLAGKFPTADRHVRIRTNMQIYWDQAFVARVLPDAPTRVETLAPVSAELHFRGFSRTYRRGGRYGPYWFAYDDVTTASPWRPIEGAFTRFGDVLPLLHGPDDMYVVMAPGDEMTVQFDAASARALPPGWRRDFLLYTDGWIKDSDLNTAHGTTVGPLPFHRIRAYPYAPGDSYPDGEAHRRYLREYNTRVVGGGRRPDARR